MELEKFLSQFHGEPMLVSRKEVLLATLTKKFNPIGDVLRVLEIGGTAHYSGTPPLRFMGLEEILQAEPFLHVDFQTKGLLPLFDCYENDFICSKLNEGSYCVFNIIDFSEYFHSPTLEGVLTQLGYK